MPLNPDELLLKAQHISKSFGREQVLTDLNFSLAEHRVLSVLGRSGSGKTTLLKIIAGLEQADEGTISLAGISIDLVPPNRRDIVYLYQESLLFPHLNVFENIAFGLRLRRESEGQIQEKTSRMLANLELAGQEKKMPQQLSGGQRQRVNFGRALIINPRLLLLDEPFGALDVTTREKMQALWQGIREEFQITAIFVTHDLKEALLMGDDIANMQSGQLKQYPNKQAFIADETTGVQKEIDFWKNLR